MREDIDKRAGAPPGTLLYAQNVRFRQLGRAQRRAGTYELGTTIEPTTLFPLAANGYPPDFVDTLGSAPVMGAYGYAHQYDSSEQAWRPAGFYSSAMPVKSALTMYARPALNRHVAANGAAAVAIDSAGYMLAAYCTQQVGGVSYVHYQYFDPTGNPLDVSEITSRVRVRCVAVGATIYMVTQDDPAASNIVRAYAFSAGAMTGPTTLFTLDATADSWDVSPWPAASAADRWLVVWYDSSSTTVTVRRMNALATEGDQTFTPAGAPRIACHAHTNHAWIGTVDDTSQAAIIRGYPWSGSWGTIVGPTNAWTFTAATEDSSPPIPGATEVATTIAITGWIYHVPPGGGGAPGGVYTAKNGRYTSAASLAVGTFYNYYPITYPFGPDGSYSWVDIVANEDGAGNGAPGPRRAALVRSAAPPTSTAFARRQFVELSAPRNGQWIDDNARVDRWTRVAQRPNGNWVVPIAVWIPNASTGDIYYDFYEFEAPCQLTRTLAASAGALTTPGQPVDLLPTGGYVSPENGVVHAPNITLASSAGGGGTMAAGDYFITACYKWIDAAGRVRRSAPARPARVTLIANDSIVLKVTTISLFRQALDASGYGTLEIYGTPPNESVFYLVHDSYPALAGLTAASPIIAFVGPDVLNYLAADITDNPQIYTDGGVQQNDLAPSCRHVVPAEDGLWAGPGWDPTIWQKSKITFPQEPNNFSDFDGYKVRFPEDTITGVNMDGALVAFAKRAIYVQIGEGPDDRGAGGFGAPRCIVSGLGCDNERSVIMSPIGCFFESERGIEILPRGLGQPVFIGEPIQDQLALRPEILDACLHVGEDATTVRFLVSDSLPRSGVSFDAASSVQVTADAGVSGSSIVASLNHALGGNTNRVVVVGANIDLTSAYIVGGATATFNGVAMVLISENLPASARGVLVFAILEAALPAAGTYSVVVTVPTAGTPSGTSSGVSVGVVSYYDATQEQPSVLAAVAGSGVAALSSVIAVSRGMRGVDFIGALGTGGTKTADAGQTERADLASLPGHFGVSDRLFTFAPASTMGWTFSSSQTGGPWLTVVGLAPIGLGAAELIYDLDAKSWSVDVHPIDAGALGVTPLGLMFAASDLSTSPAFLVEDTAYTSDDDVFFQGLLRFHDILPADHLGVAHVQGVVARVTLDANPSTVNISLGLDDLTPALGSYVGTDTASMKYVEKGVANGSNQASTVQLEVYDSTAGGVTWHGFTLFHTPEPATTRPLVSTERI